MTAIVSYNIKGAVGKAAVANNAPEFNQAYADRVSSYYGTEATPIA
jgi:hypothetical protein